MRTGDQNQLDASLMDAVSKIQKDKHDHDLGMGDVSPISPEILAETFFPKFKMSFLEMYGGKTDPHSHLANFHTTMLP